MRRETVIFGKAGFVFADSPELVPKLGAIEALQTPRIRVRKRWVRTWCKLGTEGTIELQRLPAPSSGSTLADSRPPAKGGRVSTTVTIPLSRCELILPQFEQLVAGMHSGRNPVLYRAVRKCTMRSGKSLTSDQVGIIEQGEEFRATKHAYNSDGQLRVQSGTKGWASVTARDGSPLLARQGRPWTMQIRRVLTEKEAVEAAAAAAVQAAVLPEEGVPPEIVQGAGSAGRRGSLEDPSVKDATGSGGKKEKLPRASSSEAGGGSKLPRTSSSIESQPDSPDSPGAEEAAAILAASGVLVTLQAETAEEYEAWKGVLTEAMQTSTALKKAAMNESVGGWLSTIPIGGDGKRAYDPKELLDFAWSAGLEEKTPEMLYVLFVEHQQTQGLLREEQAEQEMMMMRRARMSESGVIKLNTMHDRAVLPADPIWVAGSTVGLPGKLSGSGRNDVKLAEWKVASRDFTRVFVATGNGSRDMLLMGTKQLTSGACTSKLSPQHCHL